MVLIIKSSQNLGKDMRLIATQMVNIETNQQVYDKSGNSTTVDGKDTKRPTFNTYQHNGMEFDFQVTFGVVIMYVRSDLSFPTMLKEELDKISIPKNFTEATHMMTDYYTLVKTQVANNGTILAVSSGPAQCFRKIITDPFYIKKTMMAKGAHFVWLVLVKPQSSFQGPYMRIEELDTAYLTET